MKVLREGHCYELDNLEPTLPGAIKQVVQFIEKVQAGGEPQGTLTTQFDGTTNEEVLAMLIDRLTYLQGKFPCRENAIVIIKLEESLMRLWLNKRTADRQARNVEGKALK